VVGNGDKVAQSFRSYLQVERAETAEAVLEGPGNDDLNFIIGEGLQG
jgi:hypothetical protein